MYSSWIRIASCIQALVIAEYILEVLPENNVSPFSAAVGTVTNGPMNADLDNVVESTTEPQSSSYTLAAPDRQSDNGATRSPQSQTVGLHTTGPTDVKTSPKTTKTSTTDKPTQSFTTKISSIPTSRTTTKSSPSTSKSTFIIPTTTLASTKISTATTSLRPTTKSIQFTTSKSPTASTISTISATSKLNKSNLSTKTAGTAAEATTRTSKPIPSSGKPSCNTEAPFWNMGICRPTDSCRRLNIELMAAITVSLLFLSSVFLNILLCVKNRRKSATKGVETDSSVECHEYMKVNRLDSNSPENMEDSTYQALIKKRQSRPDYRSSYPELDVAHLEGLYDEVKSVVRKI